RKSVGASPAWTSSSWYPISARALAENPRTRSSASPIQRSGVRSPTRQLYPNLYIVHRPRARIFVEYGYAGGGIFTPASLSAPATPRETGAPSVTGLQRNIRVPPAASLQTTTPGAHKPVVFQPHCCFRSRSPRECFSA